MDWSTVAKTLETVGLPALGALLAPVTGGASLPIAAGLAALLGHKDPTNATPEDVNTMLLGCPPEVMAKLKAEDNRHAEAMEQLRQQITKDARTAASADLATQLADVDSARKREASVRDWTPRIIAFLVVGGYAFVQWYLLGHVIEASMREIVMRALGTMDAALTLILSYYFGASRMGDKQADVLGQIAKAP